MKNMADSSFQSLSVVDDQQNVVNLARLLGAFDIALKLVVFWVVGGTGAAIVAKTLAFALPIATALIVWALMRGPLLASFSALALGAAFAVTLGPLAGLLGAVVFWLSLLAALSAD